jgi:hypothetical protein
MTASTVTLNAGTGGALPLVDTLTTVDGGAAPAGAIAQMVKFGHGAASDFKTASATNPIPTRDLKDTGRNLTVYRMDTPVLTTATDSLQSLTGYKGGAAVATTTTPAVVTAGKTFRLQAVVLTYVAIVTAGSAKFTMRANTTGVVAITSPAVDSWVIGGPAAVAGVTYTVTIPVADGMEFPAGAGIGASMVGLSATQVAAAVGYGKISFIGNEY